MGLNTLDRDDIIRRLATMQTRIDKLNAILSGVPISAVRIADLTWDKSRGGTAQLGGVANGDGILVVKNSGGVTIVQLDKDGITLSNGLLVIKDASGNTVIDSQGVVSGTAFGSSSVKGSSTQTGTSGSYADVTGVTISFSLARTQNVLLFAQCKGADNNGGGTLSPPTFQALLDSTVVGTEMPVVGPTIAATLTYNTGFTQEVLSLGSGSHTLKLQVKRSFGNSSFNVDRAGCLVGYVLLGK